MADAARVEEIGGVALGLTLGVSGGKEVGRRPPKTDAGFIEELPMTLGR